MTRTVHLCLALTLATALTAEAKVWQILPDGTGDAPTIQAGIDSAVAGDTVSLEPGTYYEHDITLKSGVVIRGSSSNPTEVTIDAMQLGRVLYGFDIDLNSVVEGVLITGGTANAHPDTAGGGVYLRGSDTKFINCIVRLNSAVQGGGVALFYGSRPDFYGCLIDSNTASHRGGGLRNVVGGNTFLEGCVFRGNSAQYGGGMYCTGNGLEVHSTRFAGNEAAIEGGGVFYKNNSFGTPLFRDCVWDSNLAVWRGAGLHTESDLGVHVVQCTLSNNFTLEAEYSGGGGICFWQADQCLVDSTLFIDNSGSNIGGAICSYNARYEIRNSRFETNHSAWGGAIYGIDADFVVVRGSEFVSNSADTAGGAIALYWPEQAEVYASEFRSNSTFGFGGAYTTTADSEIESSLFTGNSADLGAAIYFFGPLSKKAKGGSNSRLWPEPPSDPKERAKKATVKTLRSLTVVGNEASSEDIIYQGEGDMTLENSIIAFNGTGTPINCVGNAITTASCSNIFGNADGDWIGCVAGRLGMNGNFSEDPFFCDTAAGDFTLDAASPCLDAIGCGLVGAFGEGCNVVTDVAEGGPFPSRRITLFPNEPNPFNPSTSIRFEIDRPTKIKLSVYDTAGRLVTRLVDERKEAGRHSCFWDGTNDTGETVGSGLYFVALRAGDAISTRKITLIR